MYKSIRRFLPIEEICDNGILKLKNNFYIKIIKVNPINYNLKSYIEKEAILNSYKLFLKNCNFNIQILIQSSKKNLNEHFFKIKEISECENNLIKNISKEYIENIKKLNSEIKTDIKNYYIIIFEKKEKNNEEIIMEKLNEKYLLIKQFISRCGNDVYLIDEKEEILKILKKSIYFK